MFPQVFRFLAPEPGIALLLIIPSVLYSRFERCRSCKRRIRVSRCEGKDRSDFEAYAFLTIRVQHLVTFSSIRRRCALPQGPTASIVVDQLQTGKLSSRRLPDAKMDTVHCFVILSFPHVHWTPPAFTPCIWQNSCYSCCELALLLTHCCSKGGITQQCPQHLLGNGATVKAALLAKPALVCAGQWGLTLSYT